jgi:D-beta-D-heptose 7-phosphate kinase/D-beta-D-heptose 1-phosphate adenosyltransferase
MTDVIPPAIPWLAGAGRRPGGDAGRPVRLAVVGEVMLDEYLDGQVKRISPEAPVPVHLVTRTFHVPGGAANAARNMKLAGGDVLLVSVCGEDDAASTLKSLLKKDKIEDQHLINVSDRPTIRKTRITAGGHQLVRVDWERVHPIEQSVQEQILARLSGLEFDGLVISDYSKGVLPISLVTNLLQLAVKRGVPAIVDPKGRDFSKYLHATLITPNYKEACEALGLDPTSEYSGEDLGRRLQRTFGLQNVLVTLGAKGMILVPPNGAPAIEMPSTAREVYDVSGAGDTVVAIMALCMAAQAPMDQAMHIANTAAGLVVEKWGTQPVELDELEVALRERPDPKRFVYSTQGKITTRETLRQILKDPGSRHRKVVFTNGCFDVVHAGHVTYLEEARSLGDLLVVGLNSDASVRGLKGPTRPYIPLAQRARLIAALGCVDFVVGFEEETPLDLITAIVPDILVKGADWSAGAAPGEKGYVVGSDVVLAAGGRVETLTYLPGLSTTAIVERIRSTPRG